MCVNYADKEDTESMDVDITAKREETTDVQMENYEDWKKRILENAYKQLKKLHTVDKNKQQNVNKGRGNPTKHKQNENLNTVNENFKIERSSPRKHNIHIDISNKYNDISNMQKDISNKQNAESNRDSLIVDLTQFSARRSPRKTPQKFEPYASPNKIKGVRLLFP